MTFSFFTFLFVSLTATLGCAEPNYVDTKDKKVTQNKATTCSIQFSKLDHCLTLTWEKEPTNQTYGQFLFQIQSNKNKQPLQLREGENLSVILWMPSMGHGAAPVLVESVSPGVFRAKNVFFTMPGEWDIRFELKSGNQLIDEAIYTLIR